MRLAFPCSRHAGAILVLAAAVLGLAACADSDDTAYQGFIGRWVGKPASQVVADWGPPDYKTAERGMDVLQYNYSEAISWGERPKRLTCSTNFLVDSAGIVRSAETEGNACFTKTSGPAARGR